MKNYEITMTDRLGYSFTFLVRAASLEHAQTSARHMYPHATVNRAVLVQN